MDLSDTLLHLFGIASRLQLRARGFGLLLGLPLILTTLVDWRIARSQKR